VINSIRLNPHPKHPSRPATTGLVQAEGKEPFAVSLIFPRQSAIVALRSGNNQQMLFLFDSFRTNTPEAGR
jgi:hypothetical protein